MSRRLALIVNPAASGGRALTLLESVRRELERRGADFRVVVSGDADGARREAESAAGAGEVVVAVGGDGLVGPLAGVVSRCGGTLAIVPAGRGNDFARVIGIPRDPPGAVAVALEGTERTVDVADVNGRSFVGIASIGFDSEVNAIANRSRVVRGELVYVYAAVRALARWRPAAFQLVVDGVSHSARGYAVAVANSKAYGGGMYLVPHAEIDDGVLEVMVTGESSKLHFLRSLPKVFKGTHVNDPAVRFWRGERIELNADRPFTVYADGDPIAELPATVAIAKRVLRVIAP